MHNLRLTNRWSGRATNYERRIDAISQTEIGRIHIRFTGSAEAYDDTQENERGVPRPNDHQKE